MDFFQLLLLAHITGDFTFQTDRIYRLKQKSPWGVPLHVLICTLVNVVVFHPLLHSAAIWLTIVFIALVHFTLDRTKLFLAVFRAKDGLGYFFIDQGLHLLSLLGAAWYLQRVLPATNFWLTPETTVNLTALLVAGFAAPPIIFYIQRAIAGRSSLLKNPAFPSFRHRLPGILARMAATLGLILGGWYNLFILALATLLVLPMNKAAKDKRSLTAEMVTSAAIVVFAALYSWYVRIS
jgi:hypothetical protein